MEDSPLISLIRKIFSFAFSLIFIISLASAADSSFVSMTLLEKAKQCVPHSFGDEFHFCNGLVLNKDRYQHLLNLDYATCKKEIESNGISIYTPKDKKPMKEYTEFLQSTKRALVLHDLKLVFFKEDAGKIDCLHELIHVYQRRICSLSDLCPEKRSQIGENMLNELNSWVDNIAALEKKKETEKARQLGEQVKPFIGFYQQWSDAINWLDEKDVHYFIYKNCDQLKCLADDREIALANLFKLKSYFPIRFNNFIRTQVADIVEHKKDKYRSIVKARWKTLSKNQLEQMSLFYSAPIPQKIEIAAKNGTDLYRALLPIRRFDRDTERVKASAFGQLPVISSGAREMTLVRPNDFDGIVAVCYPHEDKRYQHRLLLGGDFSPFSLLREMYSVFLAQNNPNLCDLATAESKLKEDFSKNRISRESFEDSLTELLVWREFIKNDFLHWYQSIEKDDAVRLGKVLQEAEFYFPHISNFDLKLPDYLSIPFTLQSSLPTVLLNHVPLVLDTGAMNSIISPQSLGNEFLNSSHWIKELTLQTVDGRSVRAPYLLIKGPFSIGESSLSPLPVAVADIGFKGINGVVGMDLLSHSDWVIDITKGQLSRVSQMPKSLLSYDLIPEYDGKYRAIEFNCANDIIVRLDTGSEVLADYSSDLSDVLKKQIGSGQFLCGDIALSGSEFHTNVDNPIFSRGVSINLGWPWASKFSKIYLSFSQGKIGLEK